jgi:UrcA family protein
MNAKTSSIYRRELIAAAILGTIGLSVAQASTAGDTSNVTVKYGDLNLSNPEGAATLYKRIVSAAYKVCAAPDRNSLWYRVELRACLNTAIADAVTKVGRPELIAIYNSKNRQHPPITVATR